MAENPMLQRRSTLRAILKRKTIIAQAQTLTRRKTAQLDKNKEIEVFKIKVKKQGTWAPPSMARDLSSHHEKHEYFAPPIVNIAINEEDYEDHSTTVTKANLTTEINDPRLADIELTYPKEPSYKTIFAVINSIIGSSILILPTLMKETGLITNLFVSLVIGLLSWHTCELYVIHVKEDEHDLHEVLHRVLGRKWQIIYGIFSGVFFNFIVLVAYYLLMCNMIYPSITFIMDELDYDNFANKFVYTWSMFSFQYVCLLVLIPVLVLLYIPVKYVIYLTQIGILPIVLYMLFIFYIFIENTASGNVWNHVHEINYFSAEYAIIAGTFGVAYSLHSGVTPIMKSNAKQENNSRDLFIGYIWSFILYSAIGVLGYLGILGKNVAKSNNIMDYFSTDSVFPLLIQLLFFFKLCCNFPLTALCTRAQFLAIFYGDEEAPKWAHNACNLILLVVCLSVSIPCSDPTTVISLNGAVCGFFILYVIPVRLHVRCILTEQRRQDNEANQPLLENRGCDRSGGEALEEDERCNSHKGWMKFRNPWFLSFYLIIIGIGLLVMVLQIKDTVK